MSVVAACVNHYYSMHKSCCQFIICQDIRDCDCTGEKKLTVKYLCSCSSLTANCTTRDKSYCIESSKILSLYHTRILYLKVNLKVLLNKFWLTFRVRHPCTYIQWRDGCLYVHTCRICSTKISSAFRKYICIYLLTINTHLWFLQTS